MSSPVSGRTTRSGLAAALAASALALFGPAASAVTVFDPLPLVNGWTGAPQSTRSPAITRVGQMVHLRGAIANGSTGVAFTVPVAYRPTSTVYVRVALCNGRAGRLVIDPAGTATVQTAGAFADATCLTSLEDVSYATDTVGFTPLALQNGWVNGFFGTFPVGVSNDDGIVRFQGAVTSGTTSTLFTLPANFRPNQDMYLPVNLCNATPGRLYIQPTGAVSVQATDLDFTKAQCFTSLEGVSFSRNGTGYTSVTLANGWTGGVSGTSQPGFRNDNGIVHLKGAVGNGTAGTLFTLPARMRPPANVDAAVDLCNAVPGRIRIGSNGVVQVLSTTVLADAQCFTSLEGVSFAIASFTPLALQNGWVGQSFGTGRPGVAKQGNVVSFTGAVSSGTTTTMFTLPASMRPATDVYVSVDLCNGARGRLYIQPSGATSVQAFAAFSDAQCFTSLEGASFMLPGANSTPLTPVNGWTGGAFGTNTPQAEKSNGIVRLAGAVGNGTGTVLFTLPSGLRPTADIYVPVNLCNAAKGRLYIEPSGVVQVQGETAFSDAQCFTSLDGVEFVQQTGSATALTLQNGWIGSAFSTQAPKALDTNGIVRFSGAVSSGTAGLITVLPVQFRPLNNVYVDVDLCNATKGRLLIQADGSVTVIAPNAFIDAQCITSLDSVSFAP